MTASPTPSRDPIFHHIPGRYPPALCDGRITASPKSILEGRQRRFPGCGIDGTVDVLQGGSDGLAVLVGDEVQAVAQQVENGVVEKPPTP